MEQAIADLSAQVSALEEAAARVKAPEPAQDFTPQVVAATASIRAAVEQISAAFPAA